jgi:hypothetical protein
VVPPPSFCRPIKKEPDPPAARVHSNPAAAQEMMAPQGSVRSAPARTGAFKQRADHAPDRPGTSLTFRPATWLTLCGAEDNAEPFQSGLFLFSEKRGYEGGRQGRVVIGRGEASLDGEDRPPKWTCRKRPPGAGLPDICQRCCRSKVSTMFPVPTPQVT